MKSYGFYESWIVTMATPVLLLGLCTTINFGAIWLEKGLGHPRTGGWLLPRLSDARREWGLQWAAKLRTRSLLASSAEHLGCCCARVHVDSYTVQVHLTSVM